MKSHNNFYWLALIALPWFISSALLFRYSVNAPRLDDFEALLHWYASYQSASGILDKLQLLFSDYQNHRYALLRLPLLLTGHINFKLYAYLSPFILLALLIATAQALVKHSLRLPLLALASLCFCNLQLWPAAVWAPLGSANLLYVTVGLSSAVLLWRQYIVTGWLLAALLCITHGSGPLLLVALGIGQSLFTRKHWQHWPFISAILLLYFVIFPSNSNSGYSSFDSSALLQLIFNKVIVWFSACLQLIGSILMENGTHDAAFLHISLVIGCFVLLLVGISFRQGLWQQTPAIWVWLLFLALVIASIAAGRALTIHPSQMLQGHYKLLSNIGLWLGISSVFLLAVRHWPCTATAMSLAVAANIYVAGIVSSLPKLQATQSAYWQDSCQFIQHVNQGHAAKLSHPASVLYVKQPNKKLKAAYESGFYRPDCSAD